MRIRADRALVLVLLALGAVILGGTLLAFALGKARPGVSLRRAEPAPRETAGKPAVPGRDVAYTALGQIRVSARGDSPDGEGAVVLVSPWFSYSPGDSAFYEELSAKNRKLRAIFVDYFSRRTPSELLRKGEAAVKKELAELINGELTLGRISELFFDEYVFFD
ncbi:MAG: hypothetical protein LBR23_09165 [Spirochaetaceae bacterium]|jgi:flagellar basal body-associated protein FliL|nr:hypothetical protein [Spirochaetaceae bacterium]